MWQITNSNWDGVRNEGTKINLGGASSSTRESRPFTDQSRLIWTLNYHMLYIETKIIISNKWIFSAPSKSTPFWTVDRIDLRLLAAYVPSVVFRLFPRYYIFFPMYFLTKQNFLLKNPYLNIQVFELSFFDNVVRYLKAWFFSLICIQIWSIWWEMKRSRPSFFLFTKFKNQILLGKRRRSQPRTVHFYSKCISFHPLNVFSGNFWSGNYCCSRVADDELNDRFNPGISFPVRGVFDRLTDKFNLREQEHRSQGSKNTRAIHQKIDPVTSLLVWERKKKKKGPWIRVFHG